MKEKDCAVNPRLGKVGGEAVLDGVMMKAGNNCPTAVRLPNGNIRVLPREFHSVREKHKWLNIPILRGVVNFVETMALSMSVLTDSAEVSVEEEVKESRVDTWMKKHLHFSLMDLVSAFSMILGFALTLALFIYLPNLASTGLEALVGRELGIWKAVTSGVIKLFIFIIYIYLVSLMPDIRRTFQYHGAEHKSIACFESGMDMTPENARKCSRFHPRCGTSFMFVMIFLGILLSLGARAILELGFGIDFQEMTTAATGVNLEPLVYTGIGLVLLPLIIGLGYEFLMYAGKHCNNWFVRICSAPGMWMQRLTTREPSDEQLEIALTAIRYALPEFFPDMDRESYLAEEGVSTHDTQ
jgi:uncharacterized protein YqhQ